ncbi:MAG TPA: alpha/beta hydrolase [Iamia sp.]|nr:alpha/beta hydrolase [Iamia sp.]
MRTRDGRTLHVVVTGEGEPTVVLEAGMGGSHHMWGAVVPALAERTRTVTYDRSGLGRSPHDDAPRDLARLASDLVDVLAHLGDGPVVLVGHSWGGPIVRAAAAQVPDRIAGVVLVDPSDEGCAPMLAEANQRRTRSATWVLPLMSRLGLLRLAVRRLARQLPEPAASGLRAEDGTRTATRTHVAEVVGSLDDLRRLLDDPPVLPDVPVTVISGAVPSRLEGPHRPALVAAHRARADAAPQGRHVDAPRSGHMVPFTEPDLVVAEVHRLLDLVSDR